MNTLIAFTLRTLLLTTYLINVHMVIQPIFHLRYEIEENFKRLVYPTIFLVIPFILIYTKGSQLEIGFLTRVFYYLWVVAFIGLIRNVYGILFGLSFVFFVSEFWEIPVYLYRLIMTGEFMVYGGVSQLFILVGILSRLSVIMYIVFFMYMTGVDWERFLKLLTWFSLIYIPLAFFIFNNLKMFPFDGHQFGWFCRILCIGLMYLYMVKYYKYR